MDIEQVNELDEIVREHGFVGYADIYLWRFNQESKSDDKIDFEIFAQLAELDSRLGTKASKQLFHILNQTTRLDIIKV